MINLYEETDEDEEHSIGSNPDDFLLTKEGENIKKHNCVSWKSYAFQILAMDIKNQDPDLDIQTAIAERRWKPTPNYFPCLHLYTWMVL